MAEQEELRGLEAPQIEILSGNESANQLDGNECAVDCSEGKKKKPRRGKRNKPKKGDEGLNGSSSNANTADNLFSLITASEIDASFAKLCVDPQTGEVNIPSEFGISENVDNSDSGPCLDPVVKNVKRNRRSKKKSAKTLNENTMPPGVPNHIGELTESMIPIDLNTNLTLDLLGRPLVANSSQVNLGEGILGNYSLGELARSLSPVGPMGWNTPFVDPYKALLNDSSPVYPQCSVIPTPMDETDVTPKKKKHRKKKKPGLNQSDASSPHVLPLNEASASPRTPKGTPNAGNGSSRMSGRHNHGKTAKKEPFSDYLPESIVKIGLESKQFIEGTIRINPKSFTEAYIADPNKGQDILIDGIKNRNRALEGDEVVVFMSPDTEWRKQSNNEMQMTAKVVFIRNRVHPRVAVGLLKPMADRSTEAALFSPRDSRVPRIRIPAESCPPGFMKEAKKYEKMLFLASITDWNNTQSADGILLKAMGPLGDLQAENAALLLENDLRTEPYAASMYSYFPPVTYEVTAADIVGREDLRSACVFTIDPATARDLDDAVSARELPDGNVEVGVHISDVSHFVGEGTPFDAEVASRATSTYLVDQVYHMLPRDLCMLCSLLPGADKLAYSVFWVMDLEGNVLSHRFTRTVINSCAQLSYEHAQEMVEDPDKRWTEDELPTIHNGRTVDDLARTVRILHRLAVRMRGRRFEGGALRIDQPKLCFSLDHATGRPTGFTCYVNKESHRLIEEFMLLANMTVAKRIFEDFPHHAFLRSHLPPHPFLMDMLRDSMESYGIHLDVSSAGALQATMKKYEGDDFPSQARMMVLYARCAKPMARARYFCTHGVDEDEFFHYALNVPVYTHFTSPIRRYPDIMVHRLLSASLGYSDPPTWIPDDVQKIASNCNKMKFAAKRAGEMSSEIYLSLYVDQLGEMLESAVVLDVKDHSFDVIVCSMGINQRIYVNNLNSAEVKHVRRNNSSVLEITWLATPDVPQSTTQTIELFSIVTVVVSKVVGALKVQSALKRPSVSGATFEQVKI